MKKDLNQSLCMFTIFFISSKKYIKNIIELKIRHHFCPSFSKKGFLFIPTSNGNKPKVIFLFLSIDFSLLVVSSLSFYFVTVTSPTVFNGRPKFSTVFFYTWILSGEFYLNFSVHMNSFPFFKEKKYIKNALALRKSCLL